MKTTAILLAGGQGQRFGNTTPKQFLILGEKPLYHHSLQAFQQVPEIEAIILVTPQNTIETLKQELLSQNLFPKLKKIVAGGNTRQQSSYHGFQAIDFDCHLVAIHDVARPFIAQEVIEACLKIAQLEQACIPASPVNDTIKRAKDHWVTETLLRSELFQVQTPQVFTYELLKKAFAQAQKDHFEGTDEASLIEHLGHPVKLYVHSTPNLKITNPIDFLIAEALLKRNKAF